MTTSSFKKFTGKDSSQLKSSVILCLCSLDVGMWTRWILLTRKPSSLLVLASTLSSPLLTVICTWFKMGCISSFPPANEYKGTRKHGSNEPVVTWDQNGGGGTKWNKVSTLLDEVFQVILPTVVDVFELDKHNPFAG